MHKSGFTLIELLISIAILAILAGMAIVSFSYYQKRAKAKELIHLARSCIQEVLTICITDSDTAINNINLRRRSSSACSAPSQTNYLENIHIILSGSCGSNIYVNATGKIKNTDEIYFSTCSYDYNTKSLTCTPPKPIS